MVMNQVNGNDGEYTCVPESRNNKRVKNTSSMYKKSKHCYGKFRPGTFVIFNTLDENTEKKLREKYVINAGIILFDFDSDCVYLGVDSKYKELGHFCGGVKSSPEENIIKRKKQHNEENEKRVSENIFEGALRELKEETLDSLHLIDDITKCPGFYCVMGNICYVHFFGTARETDFNDVTRNFEEKLKKLSVCQRRAKIEMISIQKIKISDLVDTIKGEKKSINGFTLYERFQKMIKSSEVNLEEFSLKRHRPTQQKSIVDECDEQA